MTRRITPPEWDADPSQQASIPPQLEYWYPFYLFILIPSEEKQVRIKVS
jgi:hypothetical protein